MKSVERKRRHNGCLTAIGEIGCMTAIGFIVSALLLAVIGFVKLMAALISDV